MGFTVDTAYLRGYADQIEANRFGALEQLKSYGEEHCRNFDRIDGTFYPARLPLTFAADRLRDVLGDANFGMMRCAKELRYCADSYDKSDEHAVEELWKVLQQNWSDKPDDYTEKDVSSSGGFTAGANVDLAPPEDRHLSEDAVNSIHTTWGWLNSLIKTLTGVDLLAKILPVVVGDWGALRRIAEAWDELEHGFKAVGKDLDAGMNVLSEHWDSTEDGKGGASRAFDFHIRERWVPAYDALGQVCDTMQQVCEATAQAYELAVYQLVFRLNFYVGRIRKAIYGIRAAVSLGSKLNELRKLVMSVVYLVEEVIRILWLELKMLKEDFEMLWAGIESLRNLIRGDFDALE